MQHQWDAMTMKATGIGRLSAMRLVTTCASKLPRPAKRRAKRGHAAFRLVPVRRTAFQALGRFSCDIYWFNRRVVEAVAGLTEKMQETPGERYRIAAPCWTIWSTGAAPSDFLPDL